MRTLAGKFIVLDGGDGCGKTTQSKLLCQALNDRGVQTVLVRDPGGTDVGEKIRAFLLSHDQSDMMMRCEMLLYMAARAQLMTEVIRPALTIGQCVICDRFVSSTLAYQINADGLTAKEILAVAEVAIQGRWPDRTIILDMPVDESQPRLVRPKDRIEQRSPEYHQAVRRNYLAQAAADPAHYRVVAAERAVSAVHAEVLLFLGQSQRAEH